MHFMYIDTVFVYRGIIANNVRKVKIMGYEIYSFFVLIDLRYELVSIGFTNRKENE